MEFVVNFTLNNDSLDAEFDVSDVENFDALFEIYASGTTWGNISGNIENQTDLYNILDSYGSQIEGNHQEITNINLTMQGYGDIVTHDVSEFATAAQGALADTALQPADLGDGILTIQANGTDIGTFSANQSSNETINITIPDSATWGNISGTLSNQTDLQNALNGKQDELTPGTYISISNNVISSTVTIEDLTTQAQYDALNSGADSNNIAQITTNANDISNIQDLIPAQASDSNQLADKDFVNSSIATNTANFIGTFANVPALNAYAGDVTNNDYAFVANSVIEDNGSDWATFAALDAYDKDLVTNFDYAWVENGSKFDLYRFDILNQTWDLRVQNTDKADVTLNTAYNRYKAVIENNTVTWEYEYTLNNSSFTASQWAAINSGITSGDVALIQTALQQGDNVSELVNDAGYLTSASLSNYVTLNTAQTISGSKAFSSPLVIADNNGIGSGTILSNKKILQRTSGDNTLTLNNTDNKLRLIGSETRPKYSTDGSNFNDIALYSDIPTDNNQLANGAGYITGITSTDVTTALGYTPYDSSNPSGYITSITSGDVTTALGYVPADSSSIPTVNDGTLDIQVNGTSIATFTANQSGNSTANISVPNSATWGNITGTLSNQTDLQNALNAKSTVTIADWSV